MYNIAYITEKKVLENTAQMVFLFSNKIFTILANYRNGVNFYICKNNEITNLTCRHVTNGIM